MRINTIYNCIVLFFLHAFCLLLCFQIEDIFDVDLNMGLSIICSYSYWELFLEMLYLSPFIIYYFFKKKEDTESTNFDKVFELIFSITLLIIVISQLVSCSKRIILFDLPLTPGLLCIGVNILALGLYYLWMYIQKKFITIEKVNLVRIYSSSIVLSTLLYSGIVTSLNTPFTKLVLLHGDEKLNKVINTISSLDKVYDNIDDVINTISDKKLKKHMTKIVKNKELNYEKIDKNKYKISWKTNLTKQQKDNIKRSIVYIPNEIYETNEKIIDVVKNSSNEKNKLIKIKLNKQEAEAMEKLYDIMDDQNKKLLDEQFEIERKVQKSEEKQNDKK